jgi:hypothetical protein
VSQIWEPALSVWQDPRILDSLPSQRRYPLPRRAHNLHRVRSTHFGPSNSSPWFPKFPPRVSKMAWLCSLFYEQDLHYSNEYTILEYRKAWLGAPISYRKVREAKPNEGRGEVRTDPYHLLRRTDCSIAPRLCGRNSPPRDLGRKIVEHIPLLLGL